MLSVSLIRRVNNSLCHCYAKLSTPLFLGTLRQRLHASLTQRIAPIQPRLGNKINETYDLMTGGAIFKCVIATLKPRSQDLVQYKIILKEEDSLDIFRYISSLHMTF